MVEHVWTTICRHVLTDEHSRNLSLIEVIEQVNVSPDTHRQFTESDRPSIELPFDHYVVCLWVRSTAERPAVHEGQVRIVGPDGNELGETDYAIDFEDKARFRQIIRVPTLPYAGPGWYCFTVMARPKGAEEWQSFARVPLEVKLKESENG